MKILVIDDQPIILKTVVRKLNGAGYQTHAAIDGRQGMELFDQEQPDLVIVDLMLPFVTGMELIEYIRAHETNYTKIIVLSSMKKETTVVEAFDLGVDDYVVKPFKPGEIMARIKRFSKFKFTA